MSNFNATIASTIAECSREASRCKPGVLLPVWTPIDNLTTGDMLARATIYFLGLGYLFLGVSIIADRFMAAIEVITSQEKEIHVVDANGVKQTVMVRYWNETVSNLTVIMKRTCLFLKFIAFMV
jgi:solute carrier family 8 (sodium/calcium exchanger)